MYHDARLAVWFEAPLASCRQSGLHLTASVLCRNIRCAGTSRRAAQYPSASQIHHAAACQFVLPAFLKRSQSPTGCCVASDLRPLRSQLRWQEGPIRRSNYDFFWGG
jgi:hypothetical protein